MLITKQFLKDIPLNKKEFVLKKIQIFNNELLKCRMLFDVSNGFWVRRVAGTDIYKFRINNGDRVLFTIKEEREVENIIFLRYCNHDEQIRRSRDLDRNLDQVQAYDFEMLSENYHDDEVDTYIESHYSEYIKQNAYLDASQLTSIILEDEYIAMLLDENNEDYLYYLNNDQYDCLTIFDKPLLVYGSAGSGKSIIGIRKLILNNKAGIKTAYITCSRYLKEQSKNIFEKYKDSPLEMVDFLSLNEYCLNKLSISNQQIVQFPEFDLWYKNVSQLDRGKVLDSLSVWFEISGVIKGGYDYESDKQKVISESSYIKKSQTSLSIDDKRKIYRIALSYNKWLQQNNYVDDNDLARLCMQQHASQDVSDYEFVVIDEFQDMSELQIVLVTTLSKNDEDYLVLGDANQNIYSGVDNMNYLKRKFYEKSTKIEERGLYKNYRSVSEIVRFVNGLSELRANHIGKQSRDIPEIPIRSGNRPLFIQYSKDDRKQLFEKMNERDYCAIVVATSEERDRMLLEDYPINRVFTIHEIKGLEYKNILMVNIISSYFMYWERIVDGNAKKNEFYRFFYNLIYIAATRARDQLYVIEDREESKFIPLLMPYLDKVNQFDLLQLQIESETTVKEWRSEAERLEKAELYKKAIEVYRKLGDTEGEIRCISQINNLSIHYMNSALGINEETAIRIENENGPLSEEEIYKALLKIILVHNVSFINDKIQISSEFMNSQNIKVMDVSEIIKSEDMPKTLSKLAITSIIAPDMKKNKITFHLKLVSGNSPIHITGLDGTTYDTIYSIYSRGSMTLKYARTKDKAMELMIKHVPDVFKSSHEDEKLLDSMILAKLRKQADDLYDQGRYSEAIVEYGKALEFIDTSSVNSIAAINGSIGNCYLHLNVHNKAEQYLEKAISFKSILLFQQYNSLGVIKMRDGLLNEAIELFRKSIACDSTYQTAKNNLKKATQMKKEKSGVFTSYGIAKTSSISIGRNESCFCGSGKKFKNCCMNP
ncbi:UvrD-helicase domain-containing protein [Paenibacillus sp. NPDC057934]|uniref:UvrD-helicase domain-containing protein n=1 Tax=Paenibacillus sp. NPDC057934 TaxID=3346282 RepID=UPI0036DB33BE